jgi:trehalose synthase
MIQEVKLDPTPLSKYQNLIRPETSTEIEKRAKKLTGLKIVHLNTTLRAGGVAELIRSFVPLQKGVGLDASWYVGREDSDFFGITKEIHNHLQGKKGDLSEEERNIYLEGNKRLAEELNKLKADIWIIHDPQFAAVIQSNGNLHPAIWRCHIDTSHPNIFVWRFLLPYLRKYDRYIFHMRKYIGPDLDYKKARIFPFAIDPLSPKNNPLEKSHADGIISRFGVDPNRPLVSQISRFDPWKDPWGVIDAYRIAKKEYPGLQLALIGAFSPDDPEANEVVEELRIHAKGDKDVFILSNLDGVHHLEVNAFQVASDAVVQKSIREGFGMTVSEAMWKGKPVIGGKAGGIVEQIEEGKNGFLVTTVAQTAEKILYLLGNPEKANEMGKRGKETVRDKFLITRLLLDHLKLYDELV